MALVRERERMAQPWDIRPGDALKTSPLLRLKIIG
jgi:hypothetical protein